MSDAATSPDDGPQRKPSQIRAAAKLLRKEARRIVKKHEGRLGPELSADLRSRSQRVDELLAAENWGPLERECEALDEVLHEQASFARKGALRETIENVGIAVLVALGLRSCLYEPFKIPSPSMVPTLVPGDHIFVNKFRYGIQIPFTTTIVGEDMIDGIARGEVIVFRYPLNEEEDYIKRVIGLPGDTVRVEGDAVAIKRKGESEFEYLERKRLDRACPGNYDLTKSVDNCVLFEETLDGHTYVIRIDRSNPSPTRGRTRTITVPEGGVLVMGDNRRDSADSLQWSKKTAAVFADGLITNKDLHDLTAERVFETARDNAVDTDPDLDIVDFIAERSSPRFDIALELWRSPTLGLDAVFGAASAGAEQNSLAELLAAEPNMTGPGAKKRIVAVSKRVGPVAWRKDDMGFDAAIRLDAQDTVAHLRCGVEQCPTQGELARQLAKVAESIEVDTNRPARELLSRPSGYKFIPKWSGREGSEGRLFDRVYRQGDKATNDAKRVRVRAWREPGEGADFVQAAAALALGTAGDGAADFEIPHGKATAVASESGFNVVGQVDDGALVFAIECGRARCATPDAAQAFTREMADSAHKAAQRADRLTQLVPRELIGKAWTQAPETTPELYEWDRVTMNARVRDTAYSLRVQLRHVPKAELAQALVKQREAVAGAADDSSTGGYKATAPQGHVRGFVDSDTEALVELVCSKALCSDETIADKLAERAREKLRDAENFIDPDHQVDQPFVPRGNVKGRAERIWFPFDRFWTKID